MAGDRQSGPKSYYLNTHPFSQIVRNVVGAFLPVEMESTWQLVAPQPVEAKAEHFDVTGNDSIIGETNCWGVVSLDG